MFKYLNPFYLFRNRDNDVIEESMKFASIIVTNLEDDGISSKTLGKWEKLFSQFFGKDGEYTVNPFKLRFAEIISATPSIFTLTLQRRGQQTIIVYGKGAEIIIRWYEKGRLNDKFRKVGLNVQIVKFSDDDQNSLRRFVYSNVVNYRDVTGDKLKGVLPAECSQCSKVFTDRATPELEVNSEFSIGCDCGDPTCGKEYRMAGVDEDGDCAACNAQALDLTVGQVKKLFKKMAAADKKHEGQVFRNFWAL